MHAYTYIYIYIYIYICIHTIRGADGRELLHLELVDDLGAVVLVDDASGSRV